MLSSHSTFKDLVAYVIGLIDLTIPVLFVLALVLFMWAAFKFVYKAGGEADGRERDAIIWGLISLFVIFSIWGILRLVCSTLLNSSCG